MHKPFIAHKISMLAQIFIFGKNVPSSRQEDKIYFPVNSILWIFVLIDIAVKKETLHIVTNTNEMLMIPLVFPNVLLVNEMEKDLIIYYINTQNSRQ